MISLSLSLSLSLCSVEVSVRFFQAPPTVAESVGSTSVCVRLEQVVEDTQAEIWLTFSSEDGEALGKMSQKTL